VLALEFEERIVIIALHRNPLWISHLKG